MRVWTICALACVLFLGPIATADAGSLLHKLRSCLEFKDMTKPRLDCYDEIVPPRTRSKPLPVEIVNDCRFLKDDNERLICVNRFVETPNPVATKPISATSKSAARAPAKPTTIKRTNTQGGGICRSQSGTGHRLRGEKCADRRNLKGLSRIDHRRSGNSAGNSHSKNRADRCRSNGWYPCGSGK